tara:strand:- start:334 stop:726 length:393 start_codon:yes stop_codon:yes gene_type:complete
MIKDWGFERLAKKVYEESIGEMKHADYLIERILFLGGLPNLQELSKLKIGENIPEVLSSDLSVEVMNQGCLKTAITISEELKDYISRDILETILEDTEEHIDWIETQHTLIEQAGLQNYLQEQMYSGSEN